VFVLIYVVAGNSIGVKVWHSARDGTD